jgi:hypothetical protein
MTRRILFITERDDKHALAVCEALKKVGNEPVYFSTATLASEQKVTLAFGDQGSRLITQSEGGVVSLDDITTVWNRRPKAPLLPDELSECDRSFALAENMQMLKGLWHCLRSCRWVNPYLAAVAAECKPYQLQCAQAVGLRIPQTVMTNTSEAALNFYDSCSGGVIYKPFTMYGIGVSSSGKTIYTNVLTRDQLAFNGERLALAPGIFQEYIEKSHELRVTVMGDKMFGTRIDSQVTERTRQDWRRYDLDNTPHSACELGPQLISKIQKLMASLELAFGCIDFVVTPSGEEIFLEINQAGQWYWLELLTGQPLLQAFTEFLLEH